MRSLGFWGRGTVGRESMGAEVLWPWQEVLGQVTGVEFLGHEVIWARGHLGPRYWGRRSLGLNSWGKALWGPTLLGMTAVTEHHGALTT
jgi:hypothetical protein